MARTLTKERLYNRLRELDRGIASAYLEAVDGDYTDEIDAKEAKEIFRKATDGKKITPDEAEAIALIIKEDRLAASAKEALKKEIKKKKELLYKGARRDLEGNELNDVYGALKEGSPAIDFKSPATKLHYLPTHYHVIQRMIKAERIDVYEIDARGLNSAAGLGGAVYRYKQNELAVYKKVGEAAHGPFWQSLVVHEATHAIQDWRDLKDSEVRYIEADAYTAQALACYCLGHDASRSNKPLAAAYKGTAKLLVISNMASDHPQFEDAYDELVEVISNTELYASKAEDERDFSDDRKGSSEKKIFKRLHRKLKDT